MATASVVGGPVSSARLGMGAIPYQGGVTFRVWAKFASSVSVAGDFNNWSNTANPLAPESASGYWSVDVAGAKAGDNYKFYIPGAGLRVDPYASSVFKDVAASAQNPQLLWKATVSSQDVAFDISTGFTMPNWNETVIYELHIGTFTTQPDGSQGTLITALDKLKVIGDPVNGVGFNAIEIMPHIPDGRCFHVPHNVSQFATGQKTILTKTGTINGSRRRRLGDGNPGSLGSPIHPAGTEGHLLVKPSKISCSSTSLSTKILSVGCFSQSAFHCG